jgi:hypothetical protein
METNIQTPMQPDALYDPLAGWQAASRWNAAAFDWMARSFQQWFALITTVPSSNAFAVTPAQAGSQGALPSTRAARAESPQARAVPRCPSRAKAKAKAGTQSRSRSRSRG